MKPRCNCGSETFKLVETLKRDTAIDTAEKIIACTECHVAYRVEYVPVSMKDLSVEAVTNG